MTRHLAQLGRLDVSLLAGVGDKRRQALADLGMTTVLDLLTHYPRRYVDRTAQAAIADLVEGAEATVVATVRRVTSRRTRQGRNMVEIDVSDGASYLHCTFFNQPWRAKQLMSGSEVVLFGKMETYRSKRQMTNPVVDLVGDRTGRIVAVYPQSDKVGVSTWELAGWIGEALRRAGALSDPLSDSARQRLGLMERSLAMHQIHEPDSLADAAAARQRLAFDELLRLQTVLVMRKRAVERDSLGFRHCVDGPLVDRFIDALPYVLTGAQRRAISEIRHDLAGPHPMHRLLQGDVGSGKTIVAAITLLIAVESGYQGALMAPTEVLAEQHHLGISRLMADLVVDDDSTLSGRRPVEVGLLTHRTTAAERRKLHARLISGGVDILVGTHALLSDNVSFARLAAVVIDEQHRFGVEQRAALRAKGDPQSPESQSPESQSPESQSPELQSSLLVPDVLVMTATPIPRTAAMTVYGDLDTTVLDELPPGRTPIVTVWSRDPAADAMAWARVSSEVQAGHQAYVVCPLVDESERIQARSATEEMQRLAREVLPGLRLGLLHGQLAAGDKDEVMTRFRAGEIDVLVATTVIEVGVDVPNATVMVIEDAERFGIAQLHQLRGRVGRGSAESWCYLLSGAAAEAHARLEALESISDGFELAEVDLDLRGEGAILGTRQKGVTDLKLASLRRDRQLVVLARDEAFAIVDSDPQLRANPELAEEIALMVDDDDREFLFKS